MKKTAFSLIICALFAYNSPAKETPGNYSVSGFVANNYRQGVPGVVLTASHNKQAFSATTDDKGRYTILNIPKGSYTLAPLKEGHGFYPNKIDFKPLSRDLTEQNFLCGNGVIIYDVESNEINRNFVGITWKTDVPSTSRVEYGFTPEYGNISGEVAKEKLLNYHYIRLIGLQEGSTYHFRVFSSSFPGGPNSFSTDYSFINSQSSKRSLFDKNGIAFKPNPCKTRTNLCYNLLENVDSISVTVYTLSGKKIIELKPAALNPGNNEFFWNVEDANGNDVPEGLYTYEMIVKKGNIKESIRKSNLMVVRYPGAEPGQCGK